MENITAISVLLCIFLGYLLHVEKKRVKMFKNNWKFCRRMTDLKSRIMTESQKEQFMEDFSNDIVMVLIKDEMKTESSSREFEEVIQRRNDPNDNSITPEMYSAAISEYMQIEFDSEPNGNKFI